MNRLLIHLTILAIVAAILALTLLPVGSKAGYAHEAVRDVAPAALTPSPEPPPNPTTPLQPTTPPDPVPVPQPRSGSRSGNVRVEKTAYPLLVHVGETMEFTITVTVTGGRVNNVKVMDSMPACFSITSATTTWGSETVLGNNMVVVDLGTLYSGDVITINVLTSVTCQPPAGENYNRVVVTSSNDTSARDNMTTVQFVVREPTPTPTATPTPTLVPVLPTNVPAKLPPTGRDPGE